MHAHRPSSLSCGSGCGATQRHPTPATCSRPAHQQRRRRCVSSRAAAPQQQSSSSSSSSTSQQPITDSSSFTLVETQGRSQTTHTWSYTSSADDDSSSPSSSSIDSDQPASSFRYSQTTTQQQPPSSLNSTPSTNQQQPLQGLRDSLSALFLPAGYPASVTDDYLAYQLATVPAHITGWLSIGLTTSSLLKAVGISAGPVGATAAAAGIKWIVKDGIGAAGRLLVGGRLGLEFDDDPRRWRMTAEALTTLGLSLEIATAAFPQHFLLLASLGNFSKAVGKGMGKPVFRVVQTHFAAAGVNVGAVAAKEEVWEVSAQLAGYALSVALLQQLQDAGSWQTVVGIWALVQGAHVGFRYAALKTLRFRYLNQKRAKLLVAAHVRGQRPLPSVAQGNQQEPLFGSAADMAPHVNLGCSLAEAWGVAQQQQQQLPQQPQQLPQPQLLAPWWRLYEREGYLLTWREGRTAVVLKQETQGGLGKAGGGSGSLGQQQQQLQRQQRQQVVLLRALWQAAWLEAHHQEHAMQQQHDAAAAGASSPQQQQQQQQDLALLAASLAALDREFDGFWRELSAAGWRTDQVVMRVGTARVVGQDDGGSDAAELDV